MGMMFEIGKIYCCVSVSGIYPSFKEVHDISNDKSIYMESGYIETPSTGEDASSRKIFAWHRHIVEPVCNENYVCKCVDPLTLSGAVCFPITDTSPCYLEFKNQLRDFFPDLSEPLLEIIFDNIYWDLTHVQGLSVENALICKLNQIVTPYNGSWNGFSSWEEKALTLSAICLPNDYPLLKGLIKKHVLPENLRVEFDKCKGFYVVAPNGLGLRQWYEDVLIAPVEFQ